MKEISAVQGSNIVVRTSTPTVVNSNSQDINFDGNNKVATDTKNMEALLNKYGLKQLAQEVEWNHLSSVEVKINSKGEETLCINSKKNFSIEIPINKDYNPQNIVIYTVEGGLFLTNLSGTLKLEDNANNYVDSVNLINCKITVYGNDELEDTIYAHGKNDITYITNDFADVLVTSSKEGENPLLYPLVRNIPRGKSTFNIEG